MNKDLSVGKPSTVIWQFCLPLLASVIFQQLYNLADSFVAGRFIGEKALAAVGNSYEITLIFIAVAFGLNIGCSVVVAQLFGAKRYTDLKTSIYTTFITCSLICLVLMITGLLSGKNIFALLNTPQDIMGDSLLYLNIYILGFPFVAFYGICNGIFTALGDSKTPFIFLAASSISNIAVDILFVTVFKMGVAGVAWATFLCQGVSCVLALIFVIKRLFQIKTDKKAAVFSFDLLKRIFKVAVPSMLQQGFISVGNILIQGIINIYGSAVIAGFSAAIKLNNLYTSSNVALGNGLSSFTAQNIGAGKTERIHDGFKAGIKMAWIIMIPIILLYFFAGKYLIYFFLKDPSAMSLETGTLFLRILAPAYVFISIKPIVDGILRGAGLMKEFMISTFLDLLLRVILAYALSPVLGTLGIWISWPIGWVLAAGLSLYFYRKGNWSKKALI